MKQNPEGNSNNCEGKLCSILSILSKSPWTWTWRKSNKQNSIELILIFVFQSSGSFSSTCVHRLEPEQGGAEDVLAGAEQDARAHQERTTFARRRHRGDDQQRTTSG